MDSKTRILTTIKGEKPDHIPLYCWTFGFPPPKYLRWKSDGNKIKHWYTMRLEHIHTLPEPWDINQDFRRAEKWLSIGLDDILDISVPWGVHPDVKINDWQQPPSASEPYPLLCRRYETPIGTLNHIVRKTNEEQGSGWVIQPDYVPIFEDFNIPRGIRHAFSEPEDIEKLKYILCEPTKKQLADFRDRMSIIRKFAQEHGIMTQAWTAFGMDGVVWLAGVEKAITTAMEEPSLFQQLVDLMFNFDKLRTEIMLTIGGADMIVQRGWYSSTDFWSPALFRKFVLPHLKELADMVHQAGLPFAYVMTTGLMPLLDLLKEAGIDLLYFVDPVQDNLNLKEFKQRLDGAFAVAGGINSGVTLRNGNIDEINGAVHSAVEVFSDGGFILSPVDALFPDTPEESFEAMIGAWRNNRDA